LEDSGNMPLAYISAKLHGLEDAAERIKIAIETNGGTVEGLMEKVSEGNKLAGCLLQPPTPIVRSTNWPTIEVARSTFDINAVDEEPPEKAKTDQYDNNAAMDDGFPDPTEEITSEINNLDFGLSEEADDGDGAEWEDDDDFDFGDDDDEDEPSPAAPRDDMANFDETGGFSLPESGRPPAACWAVNSSHAAVHIAGGGASRALQLLNRQIAVSDFSKLRSGMIGSYLGAMTSMPGVPGSSSLSIPLLSNDMNSHPGDKSLPRTPRKMKHLVTGIRNGYRCFQKGNFNDSRSAFEATLLDIPLVVTESKNEGNEVKEMVEICREYITAIRLKAAMAENANDPVRLTELSAYFTHCNLQPSHLLLALRTAMGTAFKQQNFIAAASFARRLLELPDMSSEKNAQLRLKASKVLQKSEQNARNEHKLNYNESATFSIDSKNLVPIYGGETSLKCGYCGSVDADEKMKNEKCDTCGFTLVGVETIGLVTGS